MAGINAGLSASGRPGYELGREDAYIGILIDDLTTKGCLEPYRMFTSRAEHRLLLRIDNADLRLTPGAREVGLIGEERWARFESRRERFDKNMASLRSTMLRRGDGNRVPATQLLRQPEIRLAQLVKQGDVALDLRAEVGDLDAASLETEVKYEGYLKRQRLVVERAQREERHAIPAAFKFEGVPGLSREVVQRLSEVRPGTLGQASRIPGVTPAAVAVIASYVRRHQPHPPHPPAG
jgi:tRNA uridine 5-carboxymethylaminomethyl modification enzyme